MKTTDYEAFEGFKYPACDKGILVDDLRRMRTANLFLESSPRSEREPLYSLRTMETNGFPSAYQIYMTSIDEYDAALRLVGSLRHWRKLLGCKWFLNGDVARGYEGLIQWREDMRMRDTSLGKGVLIKRAIDGDTSAARKILDSSTTGAAVGRPATKAAQKDQEALKAQERKSAKITALRSNLDKG
jgi:hypothetical protein